MTDPHDSLTPKRIERELLLPAAPDEVWNVVTSSGWLADDVRLELIPGGAASFRSEEWVSQGWVEEALPPGDENRGTGRLVFWWSADSGPATRVELTLEPEGNGCTRLHVVEARPLDVLDLVGIPLPGGGGSSQGPAMLVAA
ncbi:MAG TPA: SRPBCC domain-containing protein [Solirubrobacteraceae bacterium]|nr:SRPBCC domain-containing protein [Solirubrobacteraceae bacterium]